MSLRHAPVRRAQATARGGRDTTHRNRTAGHGGRVAGRQPAALDPPPSLPVCLDPTPEGELVELVGK